MSTFSQRVKHLDQMALDLEKEASRVGTEDKHQQSRGSQLGSRCSFLIYINGWNIEGVDQSVCLGRVASMDDGTERLQVRLRYFIPNLKIRLSQH